MPSSLITSMRAQAGPAHRANAPGVAATLNLRCSRAAGVVQSSSFLPASAAFRAAQPSRLLSRRRRSGRSGGLVVSASWGAEVTFSPATILETAQAADNLQRLLVDIGAEAAAAYTTPGQFIQAKVGDSKAGFFAIASPPDPNNSGVVELLIKNQGGTAEQLCTAAAGTEVAVSPVMGKGFPVERLPVASVPSVVLFATGSGISPIKALIESGALQAGERRDVRLYYGVRSPAAMAYSALLPGWEKDHGVKVIPVYSEGGKGYVQDAFASDGGAAGLGGGSSGGVGAVLCGQKDMAVAINEALEGAGVDKERILTNF